MASRQQAMVSQQQRGGGDVPKGKPRATAAIPDVKNRRALGAIDGNLIAVRAAVIEGKPINRPITRSFGAQLLAKAQANATAAGANPAANKKPVANVADKAVKNATAKEVKQKVVVKPKPEEVIEISPDIDEGMKQLSVRKTSSRSGSSSRKKIHTLTSVLTARSRAACGFTNKIEEPIPDIDAKDADDQLAAADYVEDIYKFYKHCENSSRPHDYMGSQVEINAKMRSILADWLIEVHQKFELMPETLYLTISVIDRYLSKEKVLRRELQLVGVSAMLIASKYEEIWAPEVNDFICISDRAYSREQILAMEKEILNKLEWSLTVPTPYMFLVRFIKAAMCDKEMENMVYFFAELGMMQYSMVMYCPSMIAASAVYAARCTLKKSPLWTGTLKHHTGFSEPQLFECAECLVKCHAAALDGKLKVVYKKYSSSQLGAVALLHPPAVKVLEDLKASSTSC